MASEDTADEVLGRPNFLCPEVLHPGQTGCKLSDLSKRVENIEALANEHTQTLTRVEAYGEATAFWAKAIAALIAAIGVAASIYFATLEVRSKSMILLPKTTLVEPSQIVHLNQPQDAQVRNFVLQLFRDHLILGSDLVVLAGIIFKYSQSSSKAGTVAEARNILDKPDSPTPAAVEAANTELK
jgi:hypothetical protein